MSKQVDIIDNPPRQPSSLLHLPQELLDHILSSIATPEDLLSLALSSRRCSALVIPTHIEYRTLRTRAPMPSVWAHLALRADLACNIREVHLCERNDYTALDRFPTTLVPAAQAKWVWDEEMRIRNVCRALRNMKRLKVFTWVYQPDEKAMVRVNPVHEEMVLRAVSEAGELEHLALGGKCAGHVLNGVDYPVWQICNLRSLSLVGTPWCNPSNASHMSRLLNQSPDLEFLELPVEFCHIPSPSPGPPFPRLTHLKLSLHPGGTFSSTPSRAPFLSTHPSIRTLSWFPLGPVSLPPSSLPSLRVLKCGRQVVDALEATDIVRSIECIDVWSLDTDSLARLQRVDPRAVRKVKLHILGSLESVRELAQRFEGVTWLSMPCIYLSEKSVHPVVITLDEWLDILPLFTNLEVFRGSGMWEAVRNDPDKMHDVIAQLVQLCPRLRQLDHFEFYHKRRDYKRIRITREETEGDGVVVENVRYEVRKPPQWKAFDAMDGTFED